MIQINPDWDKLQSYFSSIEPVKNFKVKPETYDWVKGTLKDFQIDKEIDNICFILEYAKEKARHIKTDHELKEHKGTRKQDKEQFAAFLKQWQQNNSISIDEVNFKHNEGNFKIKNPAVINEILQIINYHYKNDSAFDEGYKTQLKHQTIANNPPALNKSFAKTIDKYLEEVTGMKTNNRYHIIGLVFIKAKLVSWPENKPEYSTYESDKQYIVKNVRIRLIKS